MEKKEKITNIKYKQLDRDPEFKKVTNKMEQLFFGDKGIGLLEHLGMTPGKIQKSLDEQREKDIEKLIEDNKELIFWESRRRSAMAHIDWFLGLEDSEKTEEILNERMAETISKEELQVIKELIEEHM